MNSKQFHRNRRQYDVPTIRTSDAGTSTFGVLAYPLGIGAAIGLPLALPAYGAAPPLVMFAVLSTCLVLVWLAEHLIPYDHSIRQPADRDLVVDGTSMAVMMAIVDPALKSFWPVAVYGLWDVAGRPEGLGLFNHQHSVAFKLVTALLVAGLGEYWLHRLSHRWPPMWGFHALHHSAERIYWLNGFRSHPVNIAWHQLGGYAVLLFLGIDDVTLLALSCVAIAAAAFQHANANLRFGPLNYIFSTNELHRWHHDSRPGQANVNFGSVLSVWDLVFGTFRRSAREQPGSPGLEAASAMKVPKDRYWAQVLGPISMFGKYATARKGAVK